MFSKGKRLVVAQGRETDVVGGGRPMLVAGEATYLVSRDCSEARCFTLGMPRQFTFLVI
jgi:hypothetical protein